MCDTKNKNQRANDRGYNSSSGTDPVNRGTLNTERFFYVPFSSNHEDPEPDPRFKVVKVQAKQTGTASKEGSEFRPLWTRNVILEGEDEILIPIKRPGNQDVDEAQRALLRNSRREHNSRLTADAINNDDQIPSDHHQPYYKKSPGVKVLGPDWKTSPTHPASGDRNSARSPKNGNNLEFPDSEIIHSTPHVTNLSVSSSRVRKIAAIVTTTILVLYLMLIFKKNFSKKKPTFLQQVINIFSI